MKIQSIYPNYTNLLALNSPSRQEHPSFKAKPIREMSRYINIKTYDSVEVFHAGWLDSVNKMREILFKKFTAPRIMEHGPGPGNSTRVFAQIPDSQIDAVELDSECYEKLVANMKDYPNVRPILGSSLDYKPKRKVDAVISMFGWTHLNEEKMNILLNNAHSYLNKNGILVIGDEFLPRHILGSRKSRVTAHASHHNNVIAKAILDGKPELARLELDAMISGVNKVGDFKVTCSEFERRLKKAGFKSTKKYKIYPKSKDFALSRKPDTGVYVYVASLK